jgi:hypothetical protein
MQATATCMVAVSLCCPDHPDAVRCGDARVSTCVVDPFRLHGPFASTRVDLLKACHRVWFGCSHALFRHAPRCRSMQAPEVFTTKGYEKRGYEGSAADIWSCGVVLFIQLAGFPPFQRPAMNDWWFNKVCTHARTHAHPARVHSSPHAAPPPLDLTRSGIESSRPLRRDPTRNVSA